MQIPTMRLAPLLIALSACTRPIEPAPPVRLSTGASDTIVVNSRHPSLLPVRALDATGRALDGAPIRYAWTGGDSLPVSQNGAVTCSRSGNLVVRATLGQLATQLIVQCRLVEYVRIPGPLQFILGDSAGSQPLSLPLAAYDIDARPVVRFTAGIGVRDTGIASLRGLMLSPRKRGITQVGARIGDRDTGMGVHVYQRVPSLTALDTLLRVEPGQRLFAIPLSLAAGTFVQQRLPRGHWMLVMMPEADTSRDRIQLRVEGAQCADHLLGSPRRWGCDVRADAKVYLYRNPSRAVGPATGYLLVRWLFG